MQHTKVHSCVVYKGAQCSIQVYSVVYRVAQFSIQRCSLVYKAKCTDAFGNAYTVGEQYSHIP